MKFSTKFQKHSIKVFKVVDVVDAALGMKILSYRHMYAIQSSFKLWPLVDLTRSVTEPAPQYSMTSHNWSSFPGGLFLIKAP